jgi:hypothetical protein
MAVTVHRQRRRVLSHISIVSYAVVVRDDGTLGCQRWVTVSSPDQIVSEIANIDDAVNADSRVVVAAQRVPVGQKGE